MLVRASFLHLLWWRKPAPVCDTGKSFVGQRPLVGGCCRKTAPITTLPMRSALSELWLRGPGKIFYLGREGGYNTTDCT
jgi:hypothetical protein